MTPVTGARSTRPRPSAARRKQLDQKFRKNFREAADIWGYPSLRRRPVTVLIGVHLRRLSSCLDSRGTITCKVEDALRFSTVVVDSEGSETQQRTERHRAWRGLAAGDADLPSFRHRAPRVQHDGALDAWHNDRAPSRIASAGCDDPSAGDRVKHRRVRLRENESIRAGPQIFGGISGVVFGLFGYVWMKGLYEPEQGMILHPNSVTFRPTLGRTLHDRHVRSDCQRGPRGGA